MKLTGAQKRALKSAEQFGFTFVGDSIFYSYKSALRALRGLSVAGLLDEERDEDGRAMYRLTANGREVLRYGDAAFEWIEAR